MRLVMTDLEVELGQDFYKVCSSYVQAWRLPKARSESLGSMFSSKRRESNREDSACVPLCLLPDDCGVASGCLPCCS